MMRATIQCLGFLTTLLFGCPPTHAADPRYIIVHPPHLQEAADEWATYRSQQGWSTHLVPVQPDAAAVDVKQALQQEFARHGASDDEPPRVAVLLLGDVEPQGIPTFLFPQTDPHLRQWDTRHQQFASDNPYQILDDDALPDIALGRIPVRNVDEARIVLEKIRLYEQEAAPGPWRHRVNYVAGEGRYGVMDGVIEQMFRSLVSNLIPRQYDLSMTYAKCTSEYCPPPAKLKQTVLERLSEGAILFVYIGHGFEQGLDSLYYRGEKYPILDTTDVASLPTPQGGAPIAVLSCCSSGWFDMEDGQRSLAETLLLDPDGPVAVIAGSRPTHPYANAVLQLDVTRSLMIDRAPTVGDLDLAADRSMLRIDRLDRQLDRLATTAAAINDWRSSLADLRRMHVKLYNLLGDPACRIAHPALTIKDLDIIDGQLRGRIPGMVSGTLTASLKTDPTSSVEAHLIEPITEPNDPSLPERAQANYHRANQQVLMQMEVDVVNGIFAVPLEATPERAVTVSLYAVGLDEKQQPVDALGVYGLR